MKKNLTTAYDDRQYMISPEYELFYYQDTRAVKRTGMHTHSNYEYYFFLEGNVEARVNNEHYILSYGDILVVPPGIPHGLFVKNFDVPYRRFDMWISVPFYEKLLTLSENFSYFPNLASKEQQYVIHTDRISFNRVLSRLYNIIEEEKGDRFGRETQLKILISDLGLLLNRLAYESFNKQGIVENDTLYQNICTYIDNNIDEKLTLDSISEHFFLSKYYLSHVFKDNIGISIHQYISKRRLKLCHDEIISGIPVSMIYRQYGFEDYSSFYRAFRKEYGVSPKTLLQQARLDINNSAHPDSYTS